MAQAPTPEITTDDVLAPSKFELSLQRAASWVYRKRILLSVLLVAVLAICIVLWVLEGNRTKAQQAASLALSQAGAPIGALTGEDALATAREAGLPYFANETLRQAALKQGLEAYIAQNPQAPSLEVAKVAQMNLLLRQHQAAQALSEAETWLQQYPKSPAAPLVRELKARAQEANGDKAGALSTLEALAAESGPKLAAELYIRIGDLHHPALNDGKGDSQAARKAYETARALLPPFNEAEASPLLGKPGLHGRIDTYLELLP